MLLLSRAEVENLLALIPTEEDRKTVQAYLQDIEQINAGKVIREDEKRAIIKRAADIIIRIGLELGKGAAVEILLHQLHLFD